MYVCRVQVRPSRARGGLLVAEAMSALPAGQESAPTAVSTWGRGSASASTGGSSQPPSHRGRCPRRPAPPGRPASRARPGSPCGPACRRAGGRGPGWSSRRVDAQPAVDELPGGALLGLGVDDRDRLADDLAVDPPPAQLGGERPAGQPAAGVPGVDPGRGERASSMSPTSVNRSSTGSAASSGTPRLASAVGELGPGPRLQRQQPQADRPAPRIAGSASVLLGDRARRRASAASSPARGRPRGRRPVGHQKSTGAGTAASSRRAAGTDRRASP